MGQERERASHSSPGLKHSSALYDKWALSKVEAPFQPRSLPLQTLPPLRKPAKRQLLTQSSSRLHLQHIGVPVHRPAT